MLPKINLLRVRFLSVFSKCPAFPKKAGSVSTVTWTSDPSTVYEEGDLVDVGESLTVTCPLGMTLREVA